jgi:hypothetical protein
MPSQVDVFQATEFAVNQVHILNGFQDAANRGELVAFVVPVKGGVNEFKPFDAASARRIAGTDASLLLAQQIRIFGTIAKVAGKYSQNAIIAPDVIAKLPEVERDYWVQLYSYSAARDKNMALPHRNYGGGRDVKSYTPMMVLNADGNGVLTINELGFKNQIGGAETGLLYGEPYVKTYTRDKPLTDSERSSGVNFAPKPLTECGWTLNSTIHGDDAKTYIEQLRDGIKSFALDVSGPPEVIERVIQVYCYEQGDTRVGDKDWHYSFPNDRQARFAALDAARDVHIFGMQVQIISAPELRQQFYPQSVDKDISDPNKASIDPNRAALWNAGKQR